jgi:hypothetical protein
VLKGLLELCEGALEYEARLRLEPLACASELEADLPLLVLTVLSRNGLS